MILTNKIWIRNSRSIYLAQLFGLFFVALRLNGIYWFPKNSLQHFSKLSYFSSWLTRLVYFLSLCHILSDVSQCFIWLSLAGSMPEHPHISIQIPLILFFRRPHTIANNSVCNRTHFIRTAQEQWLVS